MKQGGNLANELRGRARPSSRLPKGNKEFYVLAAVRAASDSRGVLTPHTVPRTLFRYACSASCFASVAKQFPKEADELFAAAQENAQWRYKSYLRMLGTAW